MHPNIIKKILKKTWGFGNYLRSFCFIGIATVSGENQSLCECACAGVWMWAHTVSAVLGEEISKWDYIQDIVVDATDK